MNKQFLAIILVIVVGLFGVLMLTRDKGDSNSSSSSNNSKVEPSNHAVGAGNKNVTLIEYGDFQCPACRQFYPVLKEIKSQYGDQIKFQFRHFPLVQIHNNAFIASRAAEAAGKQNKFFEMHDLLYEQQTGWSSTTATTDTFVSYAQQLNLNIEQFKTDMQAESTADVINADVKAGQDLGVNSTPTFILNGKKINNPSSIDEFKKLIDDEIAKAGS